MELFYPIVLSIATIVLILILVLAGFLMQRQGLETIYPPNSNNCPDYWETDISGNCVVPGNSRNLGILPSKLLKDSAPYSLDGTSFDPNDIKWSSGGMSILCAQKGWTNSNNVIWDGKSNYNQC
jgi:hypothetical protein